MLTFIFWAQYILNTLNIVHRLLNDHTLNVVCRLDQHSNFKYCMSTSSTRTLWILYVGWLNINTLNTVRRLHIKILFILWILCVDWINIQILNTVRRPAQHAHFEYCMSAGSTFILKEYCTSNGSTFILWILYVGRLNIQTLNTVHRLAEHSSFNTVCRLAQHYYID